MKTVVFTFGRMNPPTKGHAKLVNKVQQVAKQNRADAHVYLSHTQNPKKDPLSYSQKISYAKSAFGNVVKQSNDRTVIDILKSLQKNYSSVIMVVGSDRVSEFKSLLNKYNNKDFKFDKVDVISAGARDPDAEGVEGMSASKLRELARQNNYRDFKFGLPLNRFREPKMLQLFKDVRKGMNLKEEILERTLDNIDPGDISDEELQLFYEGLDETELEEDYLEERAPLSFMQRIKKARLMKRLAPRFKRLRKIKKFRLAPLKRLQFRARQAALKFIRKRIAGKRGENYRELPISQKINIDKMIQKRTGLIDKFAKRLLPQVRKKEFARIQQARSPKKEDINLQYDLYITEKLRRVDQDDDVEKRKGTQPAKYFKDLKKSTKIARDRDFKKTAKMADDNPAAYRPAPGDKGAKTKLSKHTKKYHKMFPEGDLNEMPYYQKIRDKIHQMIHPKGYEKLLKMFLDMRKKGKSARDAVREIGQVARGVSARDFQFYIDGLVKKGKLPQSLAASNQHIVRSKTSSPQLRRIGAKPLSNDINEAVTPTPKMNVRVPQVHYNTHAAAHKAEKKYPYQAALTDLDLNTKNRNETIKEYAYGPANPDADKEAEEFWQQKADLWGTSTDMVKTMRCSNCNAFDQKPETMKIMVGALGPEGEKIVKGSNLGFCEFFEFKCAGNRVCDAWVGGGPLAEANVNEAYEYSIDEARGRKGKQPNDAEKDTENIIMQLRKSVTLRGLKNVKFDDGKIEKVPARLAQKALDMFGDIRMNNAKYKFMRSLSKSPKSFRQAIQSSYSAPMDLMPAGPAAMDRYRMSMISGTRSSIVPRSNYQIEDALERARAAIKREKDSDKIKHDRLLDTARLRKTRAQNVQTNPREEYVDEAKSAKVKDALKKKADKSGIPYGILSKVFNRGMAAYKTGHRPGTSPHQWAFARVNSYIGKGKGTYYGADKDLRNSYEPQQVGTDSSVKAYADNVPGQDYKDLVRQIKNINSNNPFKHVISEAEYQGKKVKLNDPIRTSENPKKKFKVYVKDPSSGNIKVVRFGDPNLSIKRDDPDRRKSFRARHNCDNPGPITKPRYWSCHQWRAGAKVDN